ncbi:NAD-dependent epimerase/dehydratase family protein [bacterium]|nr:NAD-dependent epimerase/dehydratase family protein [bacterium]
MRALVTGSTGFLGLNLVSELIKEGWEVYAFHRPSSDLKYLNRFAVKRIIGDIGDYSSLKSGIPQKLDALFHAAANTSLWKKNNPKQCEDNVLGTRNLVSCALEKKTKKFILTSSISSFGVHEEKIDESTSSNVLESKKASHYDKTKYLAEKEVLQGVRQGLNAVILNPCRIMGPFDEKDWSLFVQDACRDKVIFVPSGTGMICHSRNVARAHIRAVEKGGSGEKYLLGGPEATFKDIINEAQSILGKKKTNRVTPDWILWLAGYAMSVASFFTKKPPLITPETVRLLTETVTCRYQKAQQELGYKSPSLNETIGEVIDWLRKEQSVS